jgi:hypothetical protein
MLTASKVTTIQPPWRAKSIIFASLADRAAASLGVGYGQDLVVNQSRREGQRLPNIFVLQL